MRGQIVGIIIYIHIKNKAKCFFVNYTGREGGERLDTNIAKFSLIHGMVFVKQSTPFEQLGCHFNILEEAKCSKCSKEVLEVLTWPRTES